VSNEGEVYDMVAAVIPNELEQELYRRGTGEGYFTMKLESMIIIRFLTNQTRDLLYSFCEVSAVL
jgi:hypothetical protein